MQVFITAWCKLGESHQSISQWSNGYGTNSICYWYSKVDDSYNAHTEVKLQVGRKQGYQIAGPSFIPGLSPAPQGTLKEGYQERTWAWV